MERLTTNKDVSEMSMYELAHNSCYAKDGRARYRDYDTDIDAREVAKKLLSKYADMQEEFTDDEEFDEYMENYLSYGIDHLSNKKSIKVLIASFYTNLWAMADLRERLKEYEDIGLTPEQLREIDKLYAEKCKELAESEKKEFLWAGNGEDMGKTEKLKEYHDLEEQGKLLKLPCAVGDTVYRINKGKKEPIIPMLVIGIAIRNENELVIQTKDIADDNHNLYSKNSIGKTVFLTKEAAEAAVKEMSKCCGTSR